MAVLVLLSAAAGAGIVAAYLLVHAHRRVGPLLTVRGEVLAARLKGRHILSRTHCRAVSCFGSLDILVASAGIGGANNAIADETLANWEKVNAVDYTGVMLADKYAIMQFLKQGHGGAICNLASMFGLVAVPSNVAYSAAKGGVVNLTKSAGTAYASHGIRVNCVCPGVINTPLVPEEEKAKYREIHPMHRIGEDFEIASIITFLCSQNARFITGAAIPVDGGYTSV